MKFIFEGQEYVLKTPPSYPYPKQVERVQVRDRAASGLVHVEDFDVETSLLTFNFVDMPTTDYQTLLNFFTDVVEAGYSTFTVHDDIGGVFHNCRFSDSRLAFQQTDYGLWAGKFSIEQVEQS